MTAPSPSPDEQVSIGSVLDGRYRIDAVLGSGGMGRVYRGEHTGIGRAVAIKVLHADLGRNREAAQRFQREALASGRLDHPNIVGVSDFGVLDDGACFLVMEALEGESLGDRLAREKRIPWREALQILRGVLSGLRHAHERGVVHRDIKPDNVFLARKDGELVVKILDFGIAKLYSGDSNDPASTRAGLTVGTPAYLSPEQAVGGEIKPASDIYSTTIVLVEMLTGKPPFEDKDPLAMLGAHVSRPPPPLIEILPELASELPGGLEDLVQRGLMKIAAERISSATDYIAWIDAIISSAPVAAATGSAPNAAPSELGFMPTANLPQLATPIPGSLQAPVLQTPVPGSLASPIPGQLTLGSLTPLPGSAESPIIMPASMLTPVPSNQPAAATPASTVSPIRAVTLDDAAPIPRKWWVRAGVIVGAVVLLAIILAIARCSGKGSSAEDPKTKAPAADKDKQDKPDKPAARPATVPKPAPPPEPPPPSTDEEQFKAAVEQLQKGRDCVTRRNAVLKLKELGDPAAIPHLKKYRVWNAGGILGIGRENINRCLTKDADATIKELSEK